jgi:16S rRNA (cytosine1402-N4)-methyltransferase
VELAAPHVPVLAEEAVHHLVHTTDGTYLDGTVGTGGHSLLIAGRLRGRGRLICLDRDPGALQLAAERLAPVSDRVHIIKGNYADLDRIMEERRILPLDGVILDLGMSTLQLETSGRGFSFQKDEPLDMRMDPEDTQCARDLVNELPQKELERILREYGEERRARAIAKKIVAARRKRSLETSSELVRVVQSVYPPRGPGGKHPATRTFQALRIAVNRELENLRVFLEKIPHLVRQGGRLVILSYHSLEDRLVKQQFSEWEKPCTCPPDFPQCVCGNQMMFKRLFAKGIRAGSEEVRKNPKARSAVMRVTVRV